MSHTKKKPWLGVLAGITSAAAVVALSLAAPMAASAGGNHDGGHDNGAYQLVWCHQTGNDWKAQLGSGNGNGRVALEMTDTIRNLNLDNIDNSVASGNQVKAHDRSDKLDALCGDQATPEPPAPPAIPAPTVVTTYGTWTGGEPTCDNPEVTQTRTVSTTTTTYTWKWNEVTNSYDKVAHEGDSVVGTPETRTVTYQGDDCAVTPPKALSGDAVVVSQTCDSVTFKYTDTREASDTESVLRSLYLDNDTSHLIKNFTLKGGESATVVFTSVEPGTYEWGWFGGSSFDDATTQVVVRGSLDFDACEVTPPAPPAIPAPTVVTTYGTWTGGEPTCNNPEVTQTRTVSTTTTTYTWKWNGESYEKVSHEGSPVMGTPETRTVTYQGDDCVVTPPAVTPPAVTPPATHKTPTKVQTDGDMSPAAWLLGGLVSLLFAAGATGVLAVRTRRQH